MNTPVSFKLAKLLKEKGYNLYCRCSYWEGELTLYTPGYALEDGTTSQENYWDFERYYAPTIADVVMWLYEKHEYWCYTYTNGKIWYPCIQHKFGDMAVLSGKIGEFNSPTEAYEAAISYALNSLI